MPQGDVYHHFDQHLTPQDVTNYVDGIATGHYRTQVAHHLAGCRECRDEIALASRISAVLWTRRGSSLKLWLPMAGAAALALVTLLPPALRDGARESAAAPAPPTVRRAVAFHGPRGVYQMNADGSNPRLLVPGELPALWTTDGTRATCERIDDSRGCGVAPSIHSATWERSHRGAALGQ